MHVSALCADAASLHLFFVCSQNLAGVSAVLCPALRALVKMTAGAHKSVCAGSRL